MQQYLESWRDLAADDYCALLLLDCNWGPVLARLIDSDDRPMRTYNEVMWFSRYAGELAY